MPLYLTVGLPCEHPPGVTKTSECFVVGTSAHLVSSVDELHNYNSDRSEHTNTTGIHLIIACVRLHDEDSTLLTNLLRMIVYSVNGTPFVGTDHDICAVNAG